MAYSKDELKDIIGARLQDRNKERVRYLREVQALGEVVSELQADPRWERFGRPIESALRQAEQMVTEMEHKLAGVYLPPDEYAKTKMFQAKYQGRAEAFREVLNAAKTLIEAGNQAKEELEKETA